MNGQSDWPKSHLCPKRPISDWPNEISRSGNVGCKTALLPRQIKNKRLPSPKKRMGYQEDLSRVTQASAMSLLVLAITPCKSRY